MTLMQVWGCLTILIACPILGALPFAELGDRLANQRSAGFYLKLTLEILKGIGAVILSRYFFTTGSAWELLALLALAMGHYWRRKDGAMVAVLGGLILHDWQITLPVLFVGLVGLSVFRQVRLGIWEILTLMALFLMMRHGSQQGYALAAISLAGILAWISSRSPDSRKLWSIFRPGHQFHTLDQPLPADKVGQEVATLMKLKQAGYPVLPGWILEVGDDFLTLIKLLTNQDSPVYMLRLSTQFPLTQHFNLPVENLINANQLEAAILRTFDVPEMAGAKSLLIQVQPEMVWTGITYSRPPSPLNHQEPLSEIHSGSLSSLLTGEGKFEQFYGLQEPGSSAQDSEPLSLQNILFEAAQLSRSIEERQGSPQAIEWVFDGDRLWILRVRPIHHLHPVWTRAYIQELFPFALQPLSASVLEQSMQAALGKLYQEIWQPNKNAVPLTALVTHHFGYAYLNRSFWENPQHTKGLNLQKFQKIFSPRPHYLLIHPLLLGRYLRWSWSWSKRFREDNQRHFLPTLKFLQGQELSDLSPLELWERVEQITLALQCIVYHSLWGQLVVRGQTSLLQVSISPKLLTVPERQKKLQEIAKDIHNLLVQRKKKFQSRASLFAHLADIPDGSSIFQQIEAWLVQYGEGADQPWEISQRRWLEDAGSIRQRIADEVYWRSPLSIPLEVLSWQERALSKTIQIQQDIEDISQKFLAQLRWHLLAIAQVWQRSNYFEDAEDIFWLQLSEIDNLIHEPRSQLREQLNLRIQYRQAEFAEDQASIEYPNQVIYGQPMRHEEISVSCSPQMLQGQAVSGGSVIGQVRLCLHWQQPPKFSAYDILVTPYLHENLLPYLPQIKGIITRYGGMLSQGASLARQHKIPMVINVDNLFGQLQSGQWIRLDGKFGQVELLDSDTISIVEE